MMADKTHFIHGRWIAGTGDLIRSANPATEEVIWEGRSASADDVREAMSAAAEAFEPWSAIPLTERIGYLDGFRQELIAHRAALAEAISRETGKPLWDALTEVDAMEAKIGISIQAFHERRAEVTTEVGGTVASVRFKPHGVVGVVGPFNFPGHLPNGHIVPALLAGNTVVFKPSSLAPSVGAFTLELWEAAHIPAGVINMVQGGRETGVALTEDPRLHGLFFTGSVAVGKALHRQFGGKPEVILALEMGGNNPLVVHDISDINASAYLTIQSAFITAGQRCTCARRLIVPGGANGDAFVEALISMIGRIRIGAYTDVPEPFFGPLISANAVDGLLAAQADLQSRGGIPLVQVNRLQRKGHFVSPGIMDVTVVPDREDAEFFGPFLQLIRVADFDEALREANNTQFGLAAGLISDNEVLYRTFFRKIRAGVINWNRQTTGASSRLPFGGVGASGNHRPSGYYAADYCSDPVASMEQNRLEWPGKLTPGLD
ncbi:MAG TPA: succinylglutamate-semialdehyde dehydrogenase [Desulfomonilaceae bacterium]|nr:succinylglutamate-semialdehyde dehydrogenase [Desulfomonilaceae bacterium]